MRASWTLLNLNTNALTWCFFFIIQILLSDVDFWSKKHKKEKMKLQHDCKLYPPRVMMTVTCKSKASEPFKLPIRIVGCSSDSQLDMEITIHPLCEYNMIDKCKSMLANFARKHLRINEKLCETRTECKIPSCDRLVTKLKTTDNTHVQMVRVAMECECTSASMKLATIT